MYINILKKDLKRKKTMNIILLIFIIMASAFISSSVNNLLSITSAVDTFIEKSEISDVIILFYENDETEKTMDSFLESTDVTSDYFSSKILIATEKNVMINKEPCEYSNAIGVVTPDLLGFKIFNADNTVLEKVNDGEIYISNYYFNTWNLNIGDTIKVYDTTFTVAGGIKNILYGSSMVGMQAFIISENDYSKVCSESDNTYVLNYLVKTDDLGGFDNEFNKLGLSSLMYVDKSLINLLYLLDMVKSGIMLVVSICLILISIVILRFTIMFTLDEEFREIGVMKAIGIKNSRIRLLYCIKYFSVSIIGAVIGLFCGIPFGKVLLSEVSENMVMDTTSNYIINILCTILVIGVIMLFCYFATKRLNKFTPVEAIRNGSKGERYSRKNILKLSKNSMKPIMFLAANDILSNLKRFGVLIITFTIGILLIIIPVNTANTLKSEKLLPWFCIAYSDVFVRADAEISFIEKEAIVKDIAEVENKLEEIGIENAEVFCEVLFSYSISHNEKSTNSQAFQGTNITPDNYTYIAGTPPQKDNEVAIADVIAEKIDAEIGDTVKIYIGNEEKSFIVTAIFQSLMNNGEGIRFHNTLALDYANAIGTMGTQIRYTDNPSNADKLDRYERIKELFKDRQVQNGAEYVQSSINVNIDGMIYIIIIVVLCINGLVTVLMVKSFITKEKGEIGMLKAIGFDNNTIVLWQTMRIGIILGISTVLGAILSNPLGQISMGEAFKMFGASSIEFDVRGLEVYVLYPLLVFAVTITASYITAWQVRKISASETSNIE